MADLISMLAAASGIGAEEADPNFNQTVLLLHGDGTNGAQNNTFLDSSTNNFTITRNGNTTQGTFSPFSGPNGYWSNFFDGTNDRLTIADNAALRPGTGNFTIEAWVYRAAAGAAHTIFAKGGASTGFVFGITSGNVLRFTDTTSNIDSTGTVAANTWVHVAVAREGTGSNQLKLYINGVQDGQGTVSTDFNQTEEARIGENRGATDDFNGYISNFRYVVGSAIYTAGFTPSTVPLTTTSQGASSGEVELLTCQSNRFVDNSTNGFTVTRVNEVRVTPFSPFAPTAAYSPSVNGGSGYFDGSGDALSLTYDANLVSGGAGNAFTVDLWVYVVPQLGSATILGWTQDGGLTGWRLWIFGSNLYLNNPSTGQRNYGVLPLQQWLHIRLVTDGTNLSTYFNGSRIDTVAGGFSSVASGNLPTLGAYRDSSNVITHPYRGYISNVRIVKAAVNSPSDTTITIPTSPLAAISNTQLLVNFTNAGILDNTAKNVFETFADVQIDTAVKKFGTGSIEFDGTGDYLATPPGTFNTNENWEFGAGAFTIEFWTYLSGVSTVQCFMYHGHSGQGGFNVGWNIKINASGQLTFYANGSVRTFTDLVLSANTWHHVAVCGSAGVMNAFLDGVKSSTTPTYTSIVARPEVNLCIGGFMATGGNENIAATEFITGYIDDLRITKGVARYTATFTPPTAAFPNQ